MCIVYLNTRWNCHREGRCGPAGLSSFHSPENTIPAPWRLYCDQCKGLDSVCPQGLVMDPTTVIYKTLDCPTHHRRKMATLDWHWDSEWREQISLAQPSRAYYRAAEYHKQQLHLRRSNEIIAMTYEADKHNIEFYLAMKRWQEEIISETRKELTETPKEVHPVLRRVERPKSRGRSHSRSRSNFKVVFRY